MGTSARTKTARSPSWRDALVIATLIAMTCASVPWRIASVVDGPSGTGSLTHRAAEASAPPAPSSTLSGASELDDDCCAASEEPAPVAASRTTPACVSPDCRCADPNACGDACRCGAHRRGGAVAIERPAAFEPLGCCGESPAHRRLARLVPPTVLPTEVAFIDATERGRVLPATDRIDARLPDPPPAPPPRS